MGQGASSPTFAALTYNNRAYTPDGFLGGITRWRLNAMNAVGKGTTMNMYGGLVMFPDARMALALFLYCANYNCIANGKQKQDDMAATIHKRHGWENFEAMSPQDQARVKTYVRSEWYTGMMLPENARYDLETRASMTSNGSL
eukprot:TRINITY_DN9264_c4_g1_i1.p1 TRINITY_DN9264_c4_g1~~TRINITY_DN9264_c4_g1_i1.p1  ORF type:complete len:143 (+),score=30.28 TRINITY_DN9264_c4_g1_i1:57-485(+)